MNFRLKYIAIPEIDFSDFGDIMDITSLEDREEEIIDDIKLSIIFDVEPKETYDKFIDGMLYLQNKIKEILVFIGQDYDKIIIYKECVLSNMNIRLKEEPTFRTLSGHSLGGGEQIQNYILDVTFECRTSLKMKIKLFDRHKKLESVIEKIKKDGTTKQNIR